MGEPLSAGDQVLGKELAKSLDLFQISRERPPDYLHHQRRRELAQAIPESD